MAEFFEYMAQNGVDKAGELASFVNRFLADPAVIYSMTPEEVATMERHMDQALDLFRDSKMGGLS